MSKPNKPFASNQTGRKELPTVETCGGCRFWRPAAPDDTIGRCVSRPASIPGRVTAIGPLCMYPVTSASELACGLAEPK